MLLPGKSRLLEFYHWRGCLVQKFQENYRCYNALTIGLNPAQQIRPASCRHAQSQQKLFPIKSVATALTLFIYVYNLLNFFDLFFVIA